MKYLNYEGLLYYTTKIKEYIEKKLGLLVKADSVVEDLPEGLETKVLVENATQFYPVTHVDSVVGLRKLLEKHEYVDLGLSVMWATRNVGATTEWYEGSYFAFGETSYKSNYTWGTYKWCNGTSSSLTKYNNNSSYGTVDNKRVLDPEDDAAIANWGGKWRMPTKEEFEELKTNCTWEWTTNNGKNGYLVTSNKPGYTDRSIFLPAAGYRQQGVFSSPNSGGWYAHTTFDTSSPYLVNCLHFTLSTLSLDDVYNRCYGFSIRPVCSKELSDHDFTKTELDAIVGEPNTVYFTTDTKKIYLNGEVYGGSSEEETSSEHDFESTAAEAAAQTNDGIIYFTTDTKLIFKDGVAYGGSIATTQSGTASDQVAIKTVTEEAIAFYPKTHVDAVEGILKHDFDSLSADVESLNDDVVYFTADSKQIIRNGISYGGNITAEDINVVPEEGIVLQAVTFVQDCTTESNSSFTIKPNYKYIFGERSALTISLEPVTDSTIVNHYMLEFTSGSTATTLSLPASIKWTTEPSIKPNKIYLISIENNLGVIQEWS